MTQKANPSINRPAEAFKTAGAIAYGGHGGDGFVVDGADPTDISTQDDGITEADLNAFDETSDGDSLDVTIDGGEAFVFGSWLAIDTSTTVTLSESTSGQTVYVGWNKNGGDDVIVGLAADFSDASGDSDERIPLWTFDTDGSGVTATTDERRIGYTQEATTFTGDVDIDGNGLDNIDNITFGGGSPNHVWEFSSGTNRLDFRDSDGTNLIRLNNGGRIDLSADIDFLDSDSIQDNGTDAISFDGSQNVTIPNGSLTTNDDLTVSTNGAVATIFLTNDTVVTNNLGGADDYAAAGITRGDILGDPGDGYEIAINEDDGVVLMNNDEPRLNVDGDVVEVLNSRFGLPQFSSDPSASAGQMWYRSDLD